MSNLTGLLPAEQIRFLLADMTYRLAVGYGDTPAAAGRSVTAGTGEQIAPAPGSPDAEPATQAK